MKKFKLFHWVSGMLLLSTLLMSNRCHDPLWDNDSSYKSNREGIPESQYLTTLPEKAFQSKVVGTGWRLQNIRVIKPGTYELEDVSAIVSSKITPHSLYFSNDSVTVFSYLPTKNLRWGKPYTYFPQGNTIKTDALPYLQIEQVSSYLTTVEYLYTDNKGQKVYGQLNYEPMNDYELAALWRGFKEE